MNKDYYAMKGLECLTIIKKDRTIKINTANSVDFIKIGRHNVAIVGIEVLNDEIGREFETLKKSKMEFKLEFKDYCTGDWGVKEKQLNKMKFIKGFSNHSCENSSSFVYIFADCSYWKIKKELSQYLNMMVLNNILENNLNVNVTNLREIEDKYEVKLDSKLMKQIKENVLDDISESLNKYVMKTYSEN